MNFRRLAALVAGILLSGTLACAQSVVQQVGPVTPGNVAAWWADGQIYDGGTVPLPNTTNAWTAKQTFGPGTGNSAPINVLLGVAPDNPVDGDAWTTSEGLFVRINGATQGPLSSGSVRSVGLSLPNIFSVTGSPVTSTGILTAALASQSANLVLASPSGSSGTPTFRALAAADLPAGGGLFAQNATYSAGTVGAKLQQVVSITDAPYNAVADGTVGATSGTDNTAAINAALATGRPVYIPPAASSSACYHVKGLITIPDGGVLFGAGVSLSQLCVSTDFNMAALGVVRLGTTSAGGARIDQFAIRGSQPSAPANRAAMTQYPPFVYAQGCSRCYIGVVRLAGAMTGVDATGNTGGSYIERLEVGAMNVGLKLDGSLDFIHISSLHSWPFDLVTAGQLALYSDGATEALEVGRADGLNIALLSTLCGSVKFTAANGASSGANIANLQLDDEYATLKVVAGPVQVGTLYTTKNTSSSVINTGGVIVIGNYRGFSVASAIDVDAQEGTTQILGGQFQLGGNNSTFVKSSGFGRFSVNGMRIVVNQNATRTAPIFWNSGATSQFSLTNSSATDIGSGSGRFLQVDGDHGDSAVYGNASEGWAYYMPFATSYGYYDIPDYAFVTTMAPGLQTPGDFAVTLTGSTLAYQRRGNVVQLNGTLRFDVTTNSTGSGAFGLTGATLPSALASDQTAGLILNSYSKLVVPAGARLGLWSEAQVIYFPTSTTGAVSAFLDATAVPVTTGYVLSIGGQYRVR